MVKFVGSINVPTISTAPLSASEGDVYYDTTTDDLSFYVNSVWTPVGTIQNISAGSGITVSGTGDSRQVSLQSIAGSSSAGTPGTSFVKSVSPDIYGRLSSYETGSVQNASTTAAGIVQLSDSTSTTSSTIAATPTAVKSAYDLAATKANSSSPTFTGTITGAGKTVNFVHGVTLKRTTNLTMNTSLDASATAVTWSSVVDESGLYDYWSSGSTITLPETGWYSITCHLLFASGTGYAARLYCIVGGTIVAESEMQAAANTTADTIVIATLVHATAADTVVFRVSASTTTKVITGSERSRCSIVYLGDQT